MWRRAGGLCVRRRLGLCVAGAGDCVCGWVRGRLCVWLGRGSELVLEAGGGRGGIDDGRGAPDERG